MLSIGLSSILIGMMTLIVLPNFFKKCFSSLYLCLNQTVLEDLIDISFLKERKARRDTGVQVSLYFVAYSIVSISLFVCLRKWLILKTQRVWDLLCRSHWAQTRIILPACASQVLRLKASATMVVSGMNF